MKAIIIALCLLLLPAISNAMTVTLGWAAPADTTDVAGYNIYWGTTHSGPYPNKVVVNGLVMNTVVTGLPDRSKVYFVATSHNVVGQESEISNEISTPSIPKTISGFKILKIEMSR